MLTVALAICLASSAPPLVTVEGVAPGEAGRAPWSAAPVGVQLDVGVPDGIGVSLVLAPGPSLRLSLGGLSNGVGAGMRLGVMLVAFPRSLFRPLLSVDGGYVFAGQLAWLPQLLTDEAVRAAVAGLTVAFASAQVGFELGSKHVAFTLRAGLSYVHAAVPSQTFATGGATTVTARGLAITGVIPSARLGFLFSFG